MATLEIENGMFVKAWGNNVFTISREKITDAVFNFEKEKFDLKNAIMCRFNEVHGIWGINILVLNEIFTRGIKPICSPFDLQKALDELVAENKLFFDEQDGEYSLIKRKV